MVKNGCSNLCYRTFELAISHKGVNGINSFWNGDENSGQLIIIGGPSQKWVCHLLSHESPKSAVSQK